ncbi:MAG: proprotein convertase P-domain-containing protein, partial [Gammaproteobacteria bacterium]|nr:proprotein convertase P-domain-containing protein [Gammaproteobacteria bacterium]
DRQNALRVWDLTLPEPALVRDTALTAEELLQLVQRRAFDQLPAAPRLLIQLAHPKPEQVNITLRSPAGREALLQLANARRIGSDVFSFDFATVPQLRQLLALKRVGNWTLLVTDQQPGETGVLQGWAIVAAGQTTLSDVQRVNQPVPEPRTSVNAATRLSADGRRALSWPVSPDTPGPVLIWDTASAEIVARVPRDPGMRDALFVANGERVLTINADALQLWRSADGIKAGQFSPRTRGAPRVTLSTGGRYAAIPAENGAGAEVVEIWDLQQPRRVRSVVVPGAGAADRIALDAQARYLAVATRDGGVRVWELRDGRLLREYLAGVAVSDLWFDGSGSWLAVGDARHTLRVWSLSDTAPPLYERRGSSSWSVAFSADGTGLLVGSPDRAYQWVWLPQGQAAALELRHFDTAVRGVQPLAPVVPAMGDMAVTSAPAGSIKVWALPTGAPGGAVSAVRSGVYAAVSADSARVASGSDIANVRIYTPEQPASLTLASNSPDAGSAAAVGALEFSPDDRMLAAGAANGRVQLWETTGGIPLAGSAAHPDGAVQDLEFNADGSIVFSASSREVLATNTRTGQTLARLGIQADRPQLAYAPDTGIVFIAGDESGVTRWDWRNDESAMIVAGTAGVTRVATTRSGDRIVTASRDLQLTLWDVSRRVPLETTAMAAATVDALWFADNGRELLVQAGNWLHRVVVMPAGLAISATRLLPVTPAALRPSPNGQSVQMLTLGASSPRLRSVVMTEPIAKPVQGDPGQLRYDWQRRLGMTLDPQGRSRPVGAVVMPAQQVSGVLAR